MKIEHRDIVEIHQKLCYLREEENYIRELKKYFEDERHKLEIDELNCKSNIRTKKIEIEKNKIEAENKKENGVDIEIVATVAANKNKLRDSPEVQCLEPLNLNTPGFEEFCIDSD